MPHIVVAGAECRAFTGDVSEFDVKAQTVGRMIRELDVLYPGFGDHIQKRMAVAINGEIFQGADGAALPEGAEIYLIPKIGGG